MTSTIRLTVFGPLLFVLLVESSWAQFSVRQLQAVNQGSEIKIITELDLVFSEPLEEAVEHGVNLQIVTEFGQDQNSWIGGGFKVLESLKYRLSRNTLSGRYVVHHVDKDQMRTFPSLGRALQHIAIPPIVTLAVDGLEHTDTIAVRTYVDTYALPSPLRLQAFFSRRWSLDTTWTVWPIQL